MPQQHPTPDGLGASRESIDPDTLAAVERGLAQSAAGDTVNLGDFTRYLDDDGPERVFAAAVDGNWQGAVRLMTGLPEDEWEQLVMAVGGIHGLLNTIVRDRRARIRVVDNCVPCPQNPPATSG